MAINGNVVVVGASGVVGGELLQVLADRGHPGDKVVAVGTQGSQGGEVEYGGDTLEVEPLEEGTFRNVAVVFLATPADASRQLAQRAQAAGAWVVDASAAFRADASVPLAVLGRPLAPPSKGRIVACASPVPAALWTLFEPMREALGLTAVSVTALYGAGSAGTEGVAELEKETVDLMSGREPDTRVFPHRIAFNVVPQVGALEPGGDTSEESSWRAELARLWRAPPPLGGTAVHIAGFFGLTLFLELALGQGATVDALRARWGEASRVKVLDVPAEKIYPMPMLVNADEAVHVGRLRAHPAATNRVIAVASLEGARRTAAGAVEAAEVLLGGRN
jgi:aspartate-semialdehyde dehydrogenase